jgi:hypothetical protein
VTVTRTSPSTTRTGQTSSRCPGWPGRAPVRTCGAPISGCGGLAVEYWVAEDRIFYCWCGSCDWTGTVVKVERHVGHEAAG